MASPIDTLGSTCVEVYRILREHGTLDRQRIVELLAEHRGIKLNSDTERRRVAKLCSSALTRLFSRNAVARPDRAVWAPLPETGIKPADWKLAAKKRASQTGRLSSEEVAKLPELLKEQAE